MLVLESYIIRKSITRALIFNITIILLVGLFTSLIEDKDKTNNFAIENTALVVTLPIIPFIRSVATITTNLLTSERRISEAKSILIKCLLN